MTRRVHALLVALAIPAIGSLLWSEAPLARQAAAPAAATAPRTAWGDPDLQGTWNYSTVTPMQRPKEFAGKAVFTEQEAAAFEDSVVNSNNRDRRDDDESRGGVVNGTLETPDLARAYNEFWWDRGTKGVATRRTSLIVDPPDGQIPSLTAAARERTAALDEVRRRAAHGPEDRPSGERCIHQQRTGPPIMPGGYNNNLQFLQAPGYVAILSEQIHEVRIIPLDGRPHVPSSVRQWKGDSRGRWDGSTLVVETTNFNGKMYFQDTGANVRLTERFTRMNANTILYEYRIDDPESYTRPWTVQLTWSKTEEPIYEYACHEGNYGLVGSMSGARSVEKAGGSQ